LEKVKKKENRPRRFEGKVNPMRQSGVRGFRLQGRRGGGEGSLKLKKIAKNEWGGRKEESKKEIVQVSWGSGGARKESGGRKKKVTTGEAINCVPTCMLGGKRRGEEKRGEHEYQWGLIERCMVTPQHNPPKQG